MTGFFIICFLAGLCGSVLQGMIGIGTGIIIVPLLSILLPRYGVPSTQAMHIALATAMSAIAINSLSALQKHYRQGNIQWAMFKKIILFSMSGAFLGAQLASHLSGALLQIIFGIFLLAVSINLLAKKYLHETKRHDLDMTRFDNRRLAVPGFAIGMVASLIGTGGGVLMVPYLRHLKLNMPMAVGTATLLGFPVAIVGAASFVFFAESTDAIHWPALVAIALAGCLGAPLGVRLSSQINPKILMRIFAALMMLMAAKMMVA